METLNNELAEYDHGAMCVLMATHWPHLFGSEVRPLAIGIKHELWKFLRENEPGVSKAHLREFLRLHCTSALYIAAVAQGGYRFNVEGRRFRKITANHKKAANDALAAQKQA